MLPIGCVDMAHREFFLMTDVTDRISERRICFSDTEVVAPGPEAEGSEESIVTAAPHSAYRDRPSGNYGAYLADGRCLGTSCGEKCAVANAGNR